jgi:hypothetical protein
MTREFEEDYAMEPARDPLDDVRRELATIKERNARVEREKAWETSWTRRLMIATITWSAAFAWLVSLGVHPAPLHALVPTAAYFVSTLSLPVVRRWWVDRFLK